MHIYFCTHVTFCSSIVREGDSVNRDFEVGVTFFHRVWSAQSDDSWTYRHCFSGRAQAKLSQNRCYYYFMQHQTVSHTTDGHVILSVTSTE